MKNKKILIGILVVMIALIVIAIVFLNNIRSTFRIQNKEDGSITVTAENASENAGGLGYITLEEGKKLEVKTDLTDCPIKVKVLSSNRDSETEVVMEESFANSDTHTFELPSGEYTIRITAGKNATGSMSIRAK